jgi:HSP20 family protein
MALVRWDPWSDMLTFPRETQDLLRRAFGEWENPTGRTRTRDFLPAVDVFDRSGDLVVRAELPGIDPEKDVEIFLQDGVLTIRGERRQQETEKRDNIYRSEWSYGSFERRIPVPAGVKEADISANYVDGVLEVVVPKAAELPQSTRIPVTSGSHPKAVSSRGSKK